ncbi:unnamed protein product [Allacma fusca]|uniref:Uncharacterized protein n=1 Tax=Allacma fusca TaxID=39272 RepID=A0A8J2NRT9_9HEXA|nr:unnamed protein product [Allacma fusca]
MGRPGHDVSPFSQLSHSQAWPSFSLSSLDKVARVLCRHPRDSEVGSFKAISNLVGGLPLTLDSLNVRLLKEMEKGRENQKSFRSPTPRKELFFVRKFWDCG